jgi:hypothetical protein
MPPTARTLRPTVFRTGLKAPFRPIAPTTIRPHTPSPRDNRSGGMTANVRVGNACQVARSSSARGLVRRPALPRFLTSYAPQVVLPMVTIGEH